MAGQDTGRFVVSILILLVCIAWSTPAALAQDPLISEIRIDQPSTDNDEYFELSGSPGTSLGDLTYLVIGDGATGSGTIEAVVSLSGESIPASGFFTAAESTFSLGTADLTTTLNFENSDNVTHLLVRDFTGSNADDLDTDDDGVLDATPWSQLLDCVALIETVGSGDLTYCSLSAGPDGPFVPAHVLRCGASFEIGPFDPSGGLDTPGAVNACPAASASLSEIRIDQPGSDVDEYFELTGNAGGTLDGLTYLVIGDGTGGSGVIEAVVNLTGSSLDGAGFFVAAESTFTLGTANLTTSLNFENSDNVTHLLVRDFTGSIAQDLDTNDDGVLDSTPWSEQLDCLALIETVGSGDLTYCAVTAGPDGSFVPGHVFNCPGGWEIGAFNPSGGQDTPGASNACAPPPVAVDINELRIDQPGSDNDEYFELAGSAGTSLDGLTYLVIGDGAGGSGVIEAVVDLAGQSIPADGFFLTAESSFTLGTPDLTAFLNFENSDNVTHLLVQGFTGSNGDDLDTNDDGTLDSEPWSQLVDCVALIETVGSGDLTYCATTVGPDGSFVPGHVFRCDAGFQIGGFSLGTDDTPGSFNTPCIPAGWVINEIHADPAFDSECAGFGQPAGCGDANQDGQRDSTDDEFVEIFNNTGAPQDISGWTLEDSFTTRHTFPAGTMVPDQCSVVVFGGGGLSGFYGGSVVQRASGGLLGLNNSGDTVTLADDLAATQAMASYGGEGGSNQSLTRDPDTFGPFVLHTTAVGSGGTVSSAGRRVDGTSFAGCPSGPAGPVEIFEIQGAGLATPFANFIVTTNDNVVTGVGTNGFFMQTPTGRSDGDPETSDGIFVFTGSAPAVAVGDQVDVTGIPSEFFGLTEIGGAPMVSVDSGGNPLPAPVKFDADTPSPDRPQPDNEVERYEGMRVSFSGIATGPTNQFGDTPVVATTQRAFREPGIEHPGLMGLPVWDGNPEVFEIDPDGLGLPDEILFSEQAVSATGPLGFAFGDYQVLPTSIAIGPEPLLPRPVRARAAGEFTVASLSLERLFQDQPDPLTYQVRLDKFSEHIRLTLRAPDVLAVEEAEDIATLTDLANRIAADDASISYTPFLLEGNDPGGIDSGYLVRDTVSVGSVTQFAANEMFTFGTLTLPIYSRPPLVLEGDYVGNGAPFPLTVINLHNRSLSGIEGSSQDFVRFRRNLQAVRLSEFVQDLQTADPSIRLVVTGDFNAFQFTDGYVDVLGQITGSPDPLGAETPATDIVDPDLLNRVLTLTDAERYSFVFEGSAQVLDHSLTSLELGPFVRGLEFSRGNADSPAVLDETPGTSLRSSDHDSPVLYVMSDFDGDGLPDDADACPASDLRPTVIVEACDSGVPNTFFEDGCTITDLVLECAVGAANHGEFTSCVASLTNDLRNQGVITGAQKGAIQSCAASSSLP